MLYIDLLKNNINKFKWINLLIKMSISYNVGGRFGNNLFQYFATKVIGKYSNKNYVYKKRFLTVIGDNNYEDTYNKCKNNSSYLEGDIFVDGYFQTTHWINEEKDYINSLLTLDNTDKINDSYTVKDIVEALNSFDKSSINEDDLVVHIRLDDFYHQGYNSEVIHPVFLRDYILPLMNTFKRCIFVVDTLKKDWEREYMNILLLIPNSISVTNDMLKDFSLLFYSKNVLLCRSTFGWIASLISPHNKKVWFPEQFPLINSHQIIPKFNDNSIHFNPIYMKQGGSHY